jgi:hypothetical protein
MKKSHRVEHVRGTIAGVSFNDDNIISLNYSNRCSDTSDVIFGSAYIGQISAEFTGLGISWGGFRGQLVVLEYGLEFSDQTIEWIPIGTFTIQKAEWTDISISIVASDILADLDKVFTVDTTSGEVYDLIKLGCDMAGVDFERSKSEIEVLPNGDEIFGLYPQNDIKTIRDYISWLSQLIGGYVTASRSGDVTVRSFSESESVDTLNAADRIIGSVFSDYETYYDGISYVDIQNKATRYKSAGSGDGAVINLGSNPFLQYGTTETLNRQTMTIAQVANNIRYTPFSIAILNNPVYDLGDIVRCIGGVAGSQTLDCCVMGIDWSFKQTTQLQGFGADPSLSSAKSKTDKALDGLLSQTSKDEIISYTFTNAGEIYLPEDEEVSILSIRFGTVSPKTIDFWAELDLDAEYGTDPDLISVKAFYYLDNVLLTDYYPESSWNNEGMHLMHLMKFLETLEGGKSYKFEVRMIAENGTATIAAQNIHAKLSGQGLVAADEWGGLIEVADDYSGILTGGAEFGYTDTGIVFDWRQNQFISITENYDFSGIGGATFDYTDMGVDIETIKTIYNFVSEDKDYRVVSEDGNYNIESED